MTRTTLPPLAVALSNSEAPKVVVNESYNEWARHNVSEVPQESLATTLRILRDEEWRRQNAN